MSIALPFAIVLIALTIHEAAHAWTAEKLGDPTARLLGRVSLNPVVHIDPIGTILLPLLAAYSGLPIIGWAKPVPVERQPAAARPPGLHARRRRGTDQQPAAGGGRRGRLPRRPAGAGGTVAVYCQLLACS